MLFGVGGRKHNHLIYPTGEKTRRPVIKTLGRIRKDEITKQNIASLALKLLGIYSFIQAIPYVGSMISSFSLSTGLGTIKLYFLGGLTTCILHVLIGCVLFIFGHKIIQDNDTTTENIASSTDITFLDLQSIAFSVVGIVIIIFAIPKLILTAGSFIAAQTVTEEWRQHKFFIDGISGSIGMFLQILLGLGLLFGAKGLSFYLDRFRKRWNFEKDLTSH